MNLSSDSLKEFVDGYIEALLFVTNDAHEGERFLDSEYDIYSVDRDSFLSIVADCVRFLSEAGAFVVSDYAQAGHCFFLERQRHGTGFCDQDEFANCWDALSRLARSFKPHNEIYGEGESVFVC